MVNVNTVKFTDTNVRFSILRYAAAAHARPHFVLATRRPGCDPASVFHVPEVPVPSAVWPIVALLLLVLAAVLAILLAAARVRVRLLERQQAALEEAARTAQERSSLDQAAKARAEAQMEEALKQAARIGAERDLARAAQTEADGARVAAEKAMALSAQATEAMERRIGDWESVRAESLKAAQAAAFATLGEMSDKLIADHKRESEEAKQQQTEQIRTTTEGLFERFQRLTSTVDALSGQVTESRTRIDLVHRALASPGGAGHFAEIGLENTLKSFGLEAGRDFVMQYSVAGAEGRGLRPDAVVFLPAGALLVIDAKASKFLLELAAAADEAAEAEARANLARTMRQHLKDLVSRDYATAIREAAARRGEGAPSRVFNLMYLPNEGALEKLTTADPGFIKAAAGENILPCGPASLAFVLGFSRQEIDFARQAENQQRIVDQAQALLESIATALGHIEKLGRALKSASETFAGLAKSVNARLLPRSRSLAELGVRPGSAAKALPGNLPTYQLVELQSAETIDIEASASAETATAARLTDGSGGAGG